MLSEIKDSTIRMTSNNSNSNNTTSVINTRPTRGITVSTLCEVSDVYEYIGDGIPMHAGIELDMITTDMQFDGKVMGVKALKAFNKGTFLARYVGEVITDYNKVKTRMNESGEHYVAELEPDISWVCGKYLGNWTRMINHQCHKYNCKLMRFRESDNSISLGIFTI